MTCPFLSVVVLQVCGGLIGPLVAQADYVPRQEPILSVDDEKSEHATNTLAHPHLEDRQAEHSRQKITTFT